MIILKKIFLLVFVFVPIIGFGQKIISNHFQSSYIDSRKSKSHHGINEEIGSSEKDIYSLIKKRVDNINSDNKSDLL